MIELVEIDEDDRIRAAPPPPAIGLLLIDADGRYHAGRPGDSTLERSLLDITSLRGGTWIVNREFRAARELNAMSKARTVRSDEWYHVSIGDTALEWDLPLGRAEQAVDPLSRILHRAVKAIVEGVRAYCQASGTSSAKFEAGVPGAPSLATALKELIAPDIDVPDERALTTAASGPAGLLLAGVFVADARTRSSDETLVLNCHLPRYGHARRVLDRKVPASGSWKRVKAPEVMDQRVLLRELRQLELPAMIMLHHGSTVRADPYLEGWIRGQGKRALRSMVTLEEAVALDAAGQIEITGAYVGPAWKSAAASALLAHSEAVVGGPEVSGCAWSAGLAYQNTLVAAMRTPPRGQDVSPETAWVAANDRLEMIPAVQALCDAGAEFLSAYAGNLSFELPADPEVLGNFAQAAWQAGVLLPIATVRQLTELGVHLPVDRSSYGGDPSSYLLATAMQRGSRPMMWALDGVMDSNSDQRLPRLQTLLSTRGST